MMTECDPTETESSEPMLAAGATALTTPECNFNSAERPKVLFDRNKLGLCLASNPGVAVRISGSCESVLTELETDGSGEEALLLPCMAGSSASPRGAREKRGRRNRHSSSSDKDTLASPGKCPGYSPTLDLACASGEIVHKPLVNVRGRALSIVQRSGTCCFYDS